MGLKKKKIKEEESKELTLRPTGLVFWGSSKFLGHLALLKKKQKGWTSSHKGV